MPDRQRGRMEGEIRLDLEDQSAVRAVIHEGRGVDEAVHLHVRRDAVPHVVPAAAQG